MEQGDSKEASQNPPEVDSNAQSSEKDDSKKDTSLPKGSSKPESSKNSPQSLKAKSKVVKKFKASKLKTTTNNGSQPIRGRKRNRKNKKVLDNADELPKEKSLDAEKSKDKEIQDRSTTDNIPIEKKHQAKKSKAIELGKSEQKQKNKGFDKGARSGTNNGKHRGMENAESSEKKREKLGGFIFMCNAKTKPDCFRYRVMGVSIAKKDIVLGIKPGMKLFLYDFDLKLLYGIYKASSSGGMKLEPRAFGGNFPVQVRFNVTSDCFPLPESIFKKAIKENYDERNKFKTELTVRQVRKLTEFFRPVGIRSGVQPVHSPPRAVIRDREAPDGDRESWLRSHKERTVGDPYTNSNVNIYDLMSHERDHQTERREEIPRDLFLTEKSYRTYGLQGDRRNFSFASQVNPIREPYERDYESEHLYHRDPIYRHNAPAHVESLRANPLHLNESEYQTYHHGAISGRTEDPYHAYRYGASPRDPYLPPLSREEITSSPYLVGGRNLIGTDHLQRREALQDRLYSTYSASDALSEYNRMQHSQPYHGERSETTTVPVSSRYSFAGPSYLFR
ncbi:putative development/cell death domain-containing protein [Lupinus albus]|uniref:Putative development/cell death domain-containing protein n=1 Tax=Lupinus albus TaxID=3870 RepID=A0A6A4NXU6_LUPAL|nr:putative development/cell death domain-containing protein [Lupinus albus]